MIAALSGAVAESGAGVDGALGAGGSRISCVGSCAGTGATAGSSKGFGFALAGGNNASCSFGIGVVLPQPNRCVKVVDEHARLLYTAPEEAG